MSMLGIISFVSPAMLGGMVLAALPVVAHLLSRRTRRKLVFPTIRLLRESAASTARLYRIRRWVVLLLRCLAVLLIAWAFARPIWHDRQTAGTSQSTGAAVVLLLDTSASAAQHSEGVSLINSMQAQAQRTLNSLQKGTDRVGVVYGSARPHAAFPELSNNIEVIREELRRLKPTRQRTNFPKAIALAGSLLEGHKGQRRLVILSDMQRSNWSDVVLKGKAGTVLPKGTVLTILPVGTAGSGNICLSAPRAQPMQPIVNQAVELVVHVGNHSQRDRTVRLEATMNGRSIGTEQIELKAWTGGEAAFEGKLASPGQHRVVFTTSPDALAADNTAYLTVNAVRRVPVVVVGDDNPDQPGSSSYFMIRALAPRGDTADNLEVRHLTSTQLTYARVADAQAVFVAYVGRLSQTALRALHIYANQGGGVAICCGKGPVTENLLALKSIAKQGEILPWIPGPPRDMGKGGGFLQIGDGAWQSRVLAEFDEQSQDALKQMRFTRICGAGPLRPGAVSLLDYTDGTPALASQIIGAGKLMVCNFNPSLTCSDMGKYGGFVALMQSIFHSLRPRQAQYGRAVAGEPFSYPMTIDQRTSSARLTVRGPDGRRCQSDITGDAARLLVHVNRPKLPGFYDILQNDKAVACAAVNIDAREGDLRRTDPTVLTEHLSREDMVLKIRGRDEAGPILRVRGRPLWPWFVLAAMAAVCLELILLCIWKQ